MQLSPAASCQRGKTKTRAGKALQPCCHTELGTHRLLAVLRSHHTSTEHTRRHGHRLLCHTHPQPPSQPLCHSTGTTSSPPSPAALTIHLSNPQLHHVTDLTPDHGAAHRLMLPHQHWQQQLQACCSPNTLVNPGRHAGQPSPHGQPAAAPLQTRACTRPHPHLHTLPCSQSAASAPGLYCQSLRHQYIPGRHQHHQCITAEGCCQRKAG